MSPGGWGATYNEIAGIYSAMLKNFGMLPSQIDKENLADFFEVLNTETEGGIYNIDQVGGW